MELSQRVGQIQPSPTLSITAKAKKMKAEGIDVVGFGAGEPDFDTPEFIKDAAKKSLDAGFTKYTPSGGTKDLKEAVAAWFKKHNGIDYAFDEILISCGAKHSLFNAVVTLCNEGDEVIVPSPYWVSYVEMIKMAGAKAVLVPTTEENEFKLSATQLEQAITPKTKLLLLNSPSNPTGMVYTKEEVEAIAQVLVAKKIMCLSDEIYDKLIYDGRSYTSLAAVGPEVKELTITINGMSKAYSMTGWRIGFAAGPKAVIKAMNNLQDHSTSNPNSIAQAASLAAVQGPEDDLKKMLAEFSKRRDYMMGRVNKIPGLALRQPQGAFYAFVNVQGWLGKSYEGEKIKDSLALTDILLTKANVAVVPGVVFGDDGFMRLSYATSMGNIEKGLDRLEEFAKKIQ